MTVPPAVGTAEPASTLTPAPPPTGRDVAARALADLDQDATTSSAFAELATDYLRAARRGSGPVSSSQSQRELALRFDEPMPTGGRALEDVVARIAHQIVPDALHFSHPMYMGHQAGAPLPAAVWAEMVIGALNQALTVTEMSPTTTALEARVVRWFDDLIGFGAGAGGTFTSGGTEATFTALLAARARALPDAWRDGVAGDLPVVVCGENAHYSVARAAAELGLGTARVVSVPLRDWRMDPAALEATLAKLERARVPVMAVVATAGSTATGSFDDLEAIGALCDARDLWLHVDAAHGGSALLSHAHRHRLRGIARARTVAWNPHKAMMIPFAAGMLLARDERDLDAAFAQRAPYLFHGDGERRTTDTGVRTFLGARRADVLKVWVALQRYGADGLGALYDRMCVTARALYRQVRAMPAFEPLHEPEGNILCFRWVGRGDLPEDERDRRNAALREEYNRSGAGWITGTVLEGRRVLRATISNPRTTTEDTRRLVEGLAALAARLG